MTESEVRKTISETFNKCWMYYNLSAGLIAKFSWLDNMISVLLAGLKTLGVGAKYSVEVKVAIAELEELRKKLDSIVKDALNIEHLFSNDILVARVILDLNKLARRVLELYIETGFIMAPLNFEEDGFEQLRNLLKNRSD